MTNRASPTLAGFQQFIKLQKIPAEALSVSSPTVALAYNTALALVNKVLMNVPSPDPNYPSLYALAVYNLAMDRVAQFTIDNEAAPKYPGTDLPYFQGLRKIYNVNGFVGGVISSASDQGTGQSMTTPDIMSKLTFDDLQTLKTPWGRTYLGIAMTYGQSDWGLTP